MKKIALVLMAFIFVTGCEDMSGLLKVSEKFSVLVNGRSKVIPEGTHNTKLDFERERITATIEVNGRNIQVLILLPNTVSLPENGPFVIKSEQSGQPFDIKGQIQTTITRSDLKTDRETCEYRSQEPVCDQYGCTIRDVTKWGWRDIEYFEETTDKQLFFNTLSQSGVAQSRFDGASKTTTRRMTFEGQCF